MYAKCLKHPSLFLLARALVAATCSLSGKRRAARFCSALAAPTAAMDDAVQHT